MLTRFIVDPLRSIRDYDSGRIAHRRISSSVCATPQKSMIGVTCLVMLLWSTYCFYLSYLLALAERIGLRTETGSSRARLGEVSPESWLQEGSEDELSTAKSRET